MTDLLTPAEAAERINAQLAPIPPMTVNAVRKRLERRTLPGLRHGSKCLVNPAELEAWMVDKQQPQGEPPLMTLLQQDEDSDGPGGGLRAEAARLRALAGDYDRLADMIECQERER